MMIGLRIGGTLATGYSPRRYVPRWFCGIECGGCCLMFRSVDKYRLPTARQPQAANATTTLTTTTSDYYNLLPTAYCAGAYGWCFPVRLMGTAIPLLASYYQAITSYCQHYSLQLLGSTYYCRYYCHYYCHYCY